MPRVCTICAHPERPAIDRALVAGTTYRTIADRFGLSETALKRHKDAHVPDMLVQAKAAQDTADAIDVLAELQRCFERVNRLFDACDRWLRDADDPARYDIGPRADELDVTYEDVLTNRNGDPYTVRRKRKLSELLPGIESETRTVTLVETKYADPRDLVLKTATRLQGHIELLAKLMGQLDERATVNILIAPEWLTVQATIKTALAPYPEALAAMDDGLRRLEREAG